MRRLFLISNLLFISFYCFAQQSLPGKIIGKIPDKSSTSTYQIQVGAFTIEENAERAFLQLTKNALNPVIEQYLNFTRVMIKGIAANQVTNFLAMLKQAGFNEVIIREDTAVSTMEKWEINTPNSDYAWFEFNRDMYYIAVENNADKTIHFGKYTMPDKDTINMENWGVVKITDNNNTGIHFTFSPIDEPEKGINLSAVKAKTMPSSLELELLCRTWKVINCTEHENIGSLLIISNTGTYFFTIPDEMSHNLASWKWYDDTNEEFEYSHDNWDHYGRAKITSLTKNSLGIFDPGFFNITHGYSKADMAIQWELVPANDQ